MIVIAILCAAIVAAFLTGAVVFLRVGIGREESDHSLLGAPATRVATLTRRIVGLYVRTPRNVISADFRAALLALAACCAPVVPGDLDSR
jgi:hypothetical protein